MSFEILLPDDFHHHLRDNDNLTSILNIVCNKFNRIIVMPNLQPPIRNVVDATLYRDRIQSILSSSSDLRPKLTPLMTIYLTDLTSVNDIYEAKQSGFIFAAKLYPAGATTNSEFGVTSMNKIDAVLQAMSTVGMPLLVHGEVTEPSVDVFDREKVFIGTVLKEIVLKYPNLKIVLEHITTMEAVEFVTSCSSNVAATITVHHLLYNRNHIFQGGLRPHMYCLPILKGEQHRMALLAAATSGNPKFFIGTDSAPHSVESKESSCGCAGIFTGHAAIELYAEAFESMNSLDKLEAFSSIYGAQFYGLPITKNKIRLVKRSWTVPLVYQFGKSTLRPLQAGEEIHWTIEDAVV